ncbi:MAG TPA: sigma-70 family RNA polymerase sigma factor [Thermomicrobiales bacterium]|nr:sigma-70 family RNA polymerase sigma factor [Thermomicrobiales bacterium]
MSMIHLIAPPVSLTDEELVQRLAAGRDDALEPLHQRYAGRVRAFAANRLDPETADEITQDVFLTVWNKARTYDPTRGLARPWILQIAYSRILNELRRRDRRPRIVPDPDQKRLGAATDAAPQPDEAVWREAQQRAVQDALTTLPVKQRDAVRLVLLDDLTHEQVAASLQVPLGTAKTRIRDGMQRMRVALLPLVAGAALGLAGSVAAAGAPAGTIAPNLQPPAAGVVAVHGPLAASSIVNPPGSGA